MRKQIITLLLSASISMSVIPYQALAYSIEVQKLKVVASVNFRTQPSSTADRIRLLKVGELLEIVNVYNSSWTQVRDASGQIGFVSSSSSYVQNVTVNAPAEPNGVIVSSVSFRSGPSTDAARLRFFKEGEKVLVLEKVNAFWYKVQDADEVTGYVSTNSQYIDTDFAAANDDSDEKQEDLFLSTPNGTIVSSVSFRTAPSTDSSRIRYLQKNEPVLVLDKFNDYWYNVQDQNGVIGYISTSTTYINTTFVEPYKLLDKATAAEKVISAGMNYLGVPYEFGSNRYDTSTFDCSDFVRQAFREGIGQTLPGDSRSQGAYVKSIGKSTTDWRQLKRGDLIFFMSYKGSKASNYAGIDKTAEPITHVGIYLGDGKVLHTYSIESGGVRVDNIAGTPWEYRILFGGATY